MIPILYEDNHLLVVVKPPGWLSQADGSSAPDVLEAARAYIGEKYHKPGNVYLGLVHRLDRPVGGVMVLARTSKAAARLSAAIREHRMEKTYLAVACGTPPEGELVHHLVKDAQTNTSRVAVPGAPGAKRAALSLKVLETRGGLSLCQIGLLTGRSHQIRVQLAASGAPLWGDRRYNPASAPGQSVALWAWHLVLPHPVGGRMMTFSAPPKGAPWQEFDIPALNIEPEIWQGESPGD